MRNTITVPTQTEAITNHFNQVGNISGLEALSLYRVVSLTKVISVLKRKGIGIVSLWKLDNTGKRYKRYYNANFSIGN